MYEVVKRLIDLVIGSMLFLLALPIAVVVMGVLSLTGEREVFYIQERVGQGGTRFSLLKFVTMVRNSQNIGTGTVTVTGDPRVLPFGRILRKTKLNELPQIWNVLRGDLSLVGPRPLTEREFSFYSPEVQEKILEVRPGLTGIGSVVFRDEESILARSELPPLEAYRQEISPRKGALECWYIDHRSVGLDLRLVILTVLVVLLPRTALHESWLPGEVRATARER